MLIFSVGTFGIVTSAIVKAYPPIQVTESGLSFMAGSFPTLTPPSNFSLPANFTLPSNFSMPSNFTIPSNFTFQLPTIVNNTETFWHGVNLFYAFGKDVVDNGGTTYSYVSSIGNNSFSFQTTIDLPGLSKQETFDFVRPLFDSLNGIGIPVNNTAPTSSLR
jgi:hypothetical protein